MASCFWQTTSWINKLICTSRYSPIYHLTAFETAHYRRIDSVDPHTFTETSLPMLITRNILTATIWSEA